MCNMNLKKSNLAHMSRAMAEHRRNRPVHSVPISKEALQDSEKKIAGAKISFCFFLAYWVSSQEFDMHQLTIAELEVIETRELEFTSARVINGFAVWFEAGFEPWSNLSLNTSPAMPPTHWNQEVWMDSIRVVSIRFN